MRDGHKYDFVCCNDSAFSSEILLRCTSGLKTDIHYIMRLEGLGKFKAKLLVLPLPGLHEKHAVQRGIWVPTQHPLWDQGKPRKTLFELAGRRTFRMQTDFWPAVRR
jgi:hypothetical protein